jgi:N-acetyl-anhydromuramyl-L-alanine amidase AmpD
MPFSRVEVSPSLSDSIWPAPPTCVVLHATAGTTGRSSVDWLRSEGLGYHFVVARDGRDSASIDTTDGTDPIVYFCVPLRFRTAHVGSRFPIPGSGGRIANRCAIGISVANRQNGEPYTPKQWPVVNELLQLIKTELPTVTHLTTHGSIQPWNRADPVGIDGAMIANQAGLLWFRPSIAEIEAFNPGRQRVR